MRKKVIMIECNNVQKQSKTKTLRQVLKDFVSVPDSVNKKISGIVLDSREVIDKSCFFALGGTRRNGNDYIKDAVSKGAVAVVSDNISAKEQCNNLAIPIFVVPNLKDYLGSIANRFYDNPSKAITIIGVTGTNGKTSITYLLKQALQNWNKSCLYIGTLGAGTSEFSDFVSMSNTTPDIFKINSLLHTYVSGGATHCALEVSSIGLDQNRIQDLDLDVAVFTNISHDHLDYHGDLESYKKAKAKLFNLKNLKCAIINIDDKFGEILAESLKDKVEIFRVSLNENNFKANGQVVVAKNIYFSEEGCSFNLLYKSNSYFIRSKLFGRFNISNLMVVAACLISQNIPIEEVTKLVSSLEGIPGRMEKCGMNSANCPIYIDYAHTPTALENALMSLREIYPNPNTQLHLVFGCGGNRDRKKRAFMGSIAERYADSIILTSDNPRNEDPLAIIDDILKGSEDRSKFIVNTKRESAISLSLTKAEKNSIILIAGKGHEEYQEIGAERNFFSDKLTVRRLLEEKL